MLVEELNKWEKEEYVKFEWLYKSEKERYLSNDNSQGFSREKGSCDYLFLNHHEKFWGLSEHLQNDDYDEIILTLMRWKEATEQLRQKYCIVNDLGINSDNFLEDTHLMHEFFTIEEDEKVAMQKFDEHFRFLLGEKLVEGTNRCAKRVPIMFLSLFKSGAIDWKTLQVIVYN